MWSTAPAGGDTAFTFGFDPEVLVPIAEVAKGLFDDDMPTVPKFGSEPVVLQAKKSSQGTDRAETQVSSE